VRVLGAFTGGPSQVFASDRSASVQVQDITSVMIAAHAVRLGARMKTRWHDVTDADNFGGTYQFLPPLPFIPGKSPTGVVSAAKGSKMESIWWR